MKKLSKIMSNLLLAAAFTLAIISCGDDDPAPAIVMEITVEPATLNLYRGDKHTLTASISPNDTKDKTVTWSSSDANIVSVDANTGEITGVSLGTATITAAMTNGKTATSSVTVIHSVYAAGGDTNANNKYVAVLWKNGIAHKLGADTRESLAMSVFVTENNDVYVAGMESNENDKPVITVWKNGVRHQKLTDGTKEVDVRSVYVSSNDVYVAGAEKNEAGFFEAALWKNGNKQRLTNGIDEDGYAYSVFVSGSDVYVAGFEYYKLDNYPNSHFNIALLWKNGVKETLNDSTYASEAHSVYVSGNNVYVAGATYKLFLGEGGDFATVWKNGEMQRLNASSIARSVCVSDGDVYAAGEEFFSDGLTGGANVATLWKNGVKQSLDNISNETSATTVYAFGNDVYVGGFQNEEEPNEDTEELRAALWTNGVKRIFSTKKSVIASVFVK
jgi:hypothetical protein